MRAMRLSSAATLARASSTEDGDLDRIEFHQQIARLHQIAFAHVDRADRAAFLALHDLNAGKGMALPGARVT